MSNLKANERLQHESKTEESLCGDGTSELECGKTTRTASNNDIIETKELVHFLTDKIVYFVVSDGNPCDVGSQTLFEANKVPVKQEIQVGRLSEIKRSGNRYLFGLCVRSETPESQEFIKCNLNNAFTLLHEPSKNKSTKTLSIAKSPHIENIPWTVVTQIIKKVFNNSPIKIIVCKGTLQYVTENRRDEIFRELHDSPIGGHRGVSKTFNRIRKDYYWENLKQDIQRRIQQCIQCQLKKLVRLKTRQPMTITDTPETVFEKIALDIVGPLPKTN